MKKMDLWLKIVIVSFTGILILGLVGGFIYFKYKDSKLKEQEINNSRLQNTILKNTETEKLRKEAYELCVITNQENFDTINSLSTDARNNFMEEYKKQNGVEFGSGFLNECTDNKMKEYQKKW